MKTKYYSPRIRRDLVSRLYWEKEKRGIPMTTLADRLLSAALLCSDALKREDVFLAERGSKRQSKCARQMQ